MAERTFLAIDLKSFYSSVECVERGLDPLTTNLVVADESRTEKTIGLAVSPSLKSFGIPGRPRLFEVIQKVNEANNLRRYKAPNRTFTGKTSDYNELMAHPEYEIDFIVAPPQMALYVDYSKRIYEVYLKYIAPEDIYSYSIDEVFIDVTHYLATYKMTARELAMTMILDVLATTGVTATAGIGTNMYLCKVAMDVMAKHIEPDENGVRIAELDVMSYRRSLWEHKPLTDFWRIGKGIATKLEAHGMYTLGDVAQYSLINMEGLYKMFGVNAEILIDHVWGREPCTIADIKAYKPQTKSLSSGQVLQRPYDYEEAKLIVHEMTDAVVLDLVEQKKATSQIALDIGYDIENLTEPKRRAAYKGEIKKDRYGREIPKDAVGRTNFDIPTSSTKEIIAATLELFERIVDKNLLVRRITVNANKVVDEDSVQADNEPMQLDLFTDFEELQRKRDEEAKARAKEKRMQHAMLDIKKRFGKNAILKGMNLQEGATAKERNSQIGGHRAGDYKG